MPGISYLYEEYKKDPERVEKLLNEKIEVTEKLDGSRFLVQSKEGGELSFFKRKDMSITKIDRALSKYYEKAIFHFENFPPEKVSMMPDGWRFGMEYFPNLQPVIISYDRLPLNNLVLTDIKVKDPRDKTIEVITDKETLNKWADILEVEKPPIIFEGNLTDSQKRRILDFLNTPFTDLSKRFKTENFTRFILSILNPQLKKSFLHDDDEKDIDGLIFTFNGKETFRVSSPELSLKKIEKREDKPSDIYNLTLVILQEFITGIDFNKIKLKEKTYEERYIEFISEVFNMFIESPQYKKNFEKGVDFELPSFLTRKESNVNFKFVKNEKTIESLEKSNTNRELFKILLASMRSHKKRPSGFFSKELIFHHNSLVDKIADYIDISENRNHLKEASFFSFQEFKKVFLTESDSWEEFGRDSENGTDKNWIDEAVLEREREKFPTYGDLKKEIYEKPKPLKVLSKFFGENDHPKSKKRKTPVCVMMGKFYPFHKGHETVIKDANTASGCKVFLVVTTKRLNTNVVSRELHKSMLDEVLAENTEACGYIFSEGRTLSEILSNFPEKYEVKAFAGSDEECLDVSKQIDGRLEVYPMTRIMRSNQVIQKIKDEDYDSFKKLVPKKLHNYFYKIKNEMTK